MLKSKKQFFTIIAISSILISGANVASANATSRCQNVGDTQTIRGIHQVCSLVKGLKVWKVQQMRTTLAPPKPNKVSTQSTADLVAQRGCSAFWPAVQAYQKKYSLNPIGVIGPSTRALLNQGL